ncbi:MAG: sialate O-acetylesterase [Chitinophagaceae bacterium]
MTSYNSRRKTSLLARLCFLLFTLHTGSVALGQLKLSGIFADHMVLQQKMPVPVWGMAEPGKKITVRFAGQTKETTSDEQGRWKVSLTAMDASAKGSSLTVSDGSSTVKADDVLVGEVWLCSGQSNMGVSLNEVDDADKVIAAADNPMIRIFKVAQTPALNPRPDVNARWIISNHATAGASPAVGYFLAQQFQKELNVPVGVVVSCWGGSSVLAWMSRKKLDEPFFRQNVPYDILGLFENHRPGLLYNGMLDPLIPLAVKGVVWYQGESDAMDDRFNPYLYRYALRAMIDDWRSTWKRSDMPFYIVQLPNLYGGKTWPVLRESQDRVDREVSNTGMITTIDIGQSRKLHPTNKSQFAYRMADLILAEQYHIAKASKYPSFQSVKTDKDKMKVLFSDADGLKTTDGGEPLAFEIAGKDQVFKPASAKIEGTSIVVWSKDVAEPVALRYAFIPDPKVNLVGGNGLPARPFRTDTWEVTGQQRLAQALPVKAKLDTEFPPQKILDGEYKDWQWTGSTTLDALNTNKSLQKLGKDKVKVQVVSRRNPDEKESSPAISWKRSMPATANGMTFEIGAQLARANYPYPGFSLKVGVQDGSKLNLYQIDFSMLTIVAYKEEFIYVLANDVDNTDDYQYRLAIRKDGICQVYFDHKLIGVIPPEVVEDKDAVAKGSFISFGKLRAEGDIVVNIGSVSFDGTGAYAPSEKANP